MPVKFPADIPTTPGVYRFADGAGRALYVGKAKNLRNRLASYARGKVDARIRRMLELAQDVTYVTCASESEALLLEREWISGQQPPYNIRLRNGNGYAGIAVTPGEIPRVAIWRGTRPEAGETFGPYPGTTGKAVLSAVTGAFGVRTCRDTTLAHAQQANRACLLGETGECLAPCLGGARQAMHEQAIADMRAFLLGGRRDLVGHLEAQMHSYAAQENFEAARVSRDRAAALRDLGQRQTVISATALEAVAVALRRTEHDLVVAATQARNGVVIAVETYRSANDPQASDEDATDLVLEELARRIPGTAHFLCVGPGKLAKRPRGKAQRDLVAFTERQADEAARAAEMSPWNNAHERMNAVAELTEALGLPRLARRIEAIDVSHLNGASAHARLITLVDGYPQPRDYRSVPVPDAHGDDYAAIGQILQARLSGSRLGLTEMPDLLLIDGGQGQVATAYKTATQLGRSTPIVGLAKRLEEAWTPGSDAPLILARDSAALRLLIHARDTVHNAAIGKHRASRRASTVSLRADSAPGVGPKRKAKLLSSFGSWDAVSGASLSDLQAVLGPSTGSALFDHLHQKKHDETGTRVPESAGKPQ